MSAILNSIVAETAAEFGFPPEALLTPWKRSDVVRARHVGIYVARVCTRHSLWQIGEAFHRNHSTIGYGIAKIEEEMLGNAALAERVQRIMARVAPGMTLPAHEPADAADPIDQLVELLVPRLAEILIPLLTQENRTAQNDR
ncbi:Chromosomal replication initiator protein DnaA [Hartmannibacter diazotrophicus]|uniref:Chromosomal replication initiator protein DnaA n=1 Tax=Hartmannibacter diazotrophicus TaxID=1482074 RepID=A0A2C9D7Q5_9HYPH|nr:helix-turn-helix domain-containing protein [Hartmannibacter diazotrophicus]SON55781.1 Chromosomal replication initiator protein DnaA [Hartmannibacter diazotrophicus]